jgi:hypothetical protein
MRGICRDRARSKASQVDHYNERLVCNRNLRLSDRIADSGIQTPCPFWCKPPRTVNADGDHRNREGSVCKGRRVVGRCSRVTISDSSKTYSTEAFALAMSLLDIAKTVNAASEENMKYAAERPFAEPEKAAARAVFLASWRAEFGAHRCGHDLATPDDLACLGLC